MKQYTTPEQTAKLIELGFEEPNSLTGDYSITDYGDMESIEMKCAYSIGELFSFLPQTINVFYDLSILSSHKGWWVLYGMLGDGDMWSIEHEVYRNDLVDALYEMAVILKEKGVI